MDCLHYSMPLTVSSHYALTHKYVCVHISVGIIKCVGSDQEGCACCLLLSLLKDLVFLSLLLTHDLSTIFPCQYLLTVNIAFQLRKGKTMHRAINEMAAGEKEQR